MAGSYSEPCQIPRSALLPSPILLHYKLSKVSHVTSTNYFSLQI